MINSIINGIAPFTTPTNTGTELESLNFSFSSEAKRLQIATISSFVTSALFNNAATSAISTVLGLFASIGINALTGKLKKVLTFLNQIPMLQAEIVTGISIMIIFSLLI